MTKISPLRYRRVLFCAVLLAQSGCAGVLSHSQMPISCANAPAAKAAIEVTRHALARASETIDNACAPRGIGRAALAGAAIDGQ